MIASRFLFAAAVPFSLLFAVACGGDDAATGETGPSTAGAAGKAGGAGKGGVAGKGGSGTAGKGGSEATGGGSGKGGTAGKGGSAGSGGASGEGGSEATAGRGGEAGAAQGGSAGAAAGGSAGTAQGGSAGAATAGAGGASGGAGGAATCHGTALGADDPRFVVVAHNYADPTGPYKGDKYQVLTLSTAGALSKANNKFTMGRADGKPIVFTPDGQLGFVPQENGKIGEFRLSADGKAEVLEKTFDVGGYAEQLLVDETGTRLLVLSTNTTANGGGIYEATIGCDGKLTAKGKIITANLPAAMAWVPGRPGVLAVGARSIGASPADTDTHLLDVAQDPPVVVSSAKAYPSKEPFIASLAVTADGKNVMLVVNGILSDEGAGVVTITGDTLEAKKPLAFDGSTWVIASPWSNLALGLAADGKNDGYYSFAYTPGVAAPFAAPKKVVVSPKAQLPDVAVVFGRGVRKGLALAPEVEGIRTIRLTEDGSVGEGGVFKLDNPADLDFEENPGPLGFAP